MSQLRLWWEGRSRLEIVTYTLMIVALIFAVALGAGHLVANSIR